MPERKPRNRRKPRGRGKYAPLVWLITGALIALAISYSNVLFNKGANPFKQTNSVENNTVERKSLATIASNFLNRQKPANGQTITNQPDNTSTVKVRLFVAGKGENSVRLIWKEIAIPRSESLLKDTIETLITLKNGDDYINLIPYNTRVNKVWISDGVAHIDFDEHFANNSYGLIGYKVQVYQVVYTAVQFSSVKAVHFYVNGKTLKYLGGDGYILDNPVYPLSTLPEFPI